MGDRKEIEVMMKCIRPYCTYIYSVIWLSVVCNGGVMSELKYEHGK